MSRPMPILVRIRRSSLESPPTSLTESFPVRPPRWRSLQLMGMSGAGPASPRQPWHPRPVAHAREHPAEEPVRLAHPDGAAGIPPSPLQPGVGVTATSGGISGSGGRSSRAAPTALAMAVCP